MQQHRYTYEHVFKDIKIAYDKCTNYFFHSHRHIELHHVVNGEMEVFINNKWFKLDEGCMAVIFPYQVHNTKICTGISYSAVFNLDLLDLFSYTLLTCTCNEPIIRKPQSEFLEILMKYAYEIYSTQPPLAYEELISILSAVMGHSLSCLNDKIVPSVDVPQEVSIQKIINYCVENAYNSDFSRSTVSRHFHLTPTYISRIFSEKIGIDFIEFINSQRIEQACKLLKFSNITITEIQYACGFNSQTTFNRCFKKLLGTTPQAYRKMNSENQKNQ